MRAVVLEDHGEPDVLRVADVADPEPGPDEIQLEVVSTALNRADLLQRRGLYPDPDRTRLLKALERSGSTPPPEIPGMEFAGRVSALGARATEWSVSDSVMGIVAGGAYAERLCVHERQAIAVPEGLELADAGAVPEVFITAFDALVAQGGLASGGWALVHAGGSGVGTASIQIVKAIGARIVVTASAGKVEACRALGADVVVDYTSANYVDAVQNATGGTGVDVVLDVIGGDYLDRNVDALRVGGRIVQVGVMGGGKTTFALGKLLPKRAQLVGTVLRGRPAEEKIAISRRFARELGPRFTDGSLRPVIDSRFELDDVAEAHRRMESNANVGKIVLDVAPG